MRRTVGVPEKPLFSNKDILHMMVPLITEQALTCLVGLADSIMVAQAGEAAVSGVSLVDSISVLITMMLSAVAAGGAIVAGHFLGQRDIEDAKKVSNQLMTFMVVFSAAITLLLYLLRRPMFALFFGDIAPDVYESATIYYMITTISTPFFAVFTTGSAIFRTMGKSLPSMQVSAIMNAVNIFGNAILIFGLRMGVMGVAIPTALSRVVAAVIIFRRLRDPAHTLQMEPQLLRRWHGGTVRHILRLGLPNGIESSMFQFGKIIMLAVVSRFGTAAIAANAIGNTMANFESLPGNAINLGIVAIVAQCVGASDYKQARYYVHKLISLIYACHIALNAIIVLATPLIISVYNLSPEGAVMARQTILLHSIFCMIHWCPSFALPAALRAAGDAKYTMTVGVLSMCVVRLICGWILAVPCGFGMIGIWYAMLIDWAVRSYFYITRYQSDRWYTRITMHSKL
ncbi:MAG: MATE family efflux transporter [Butyricicoccus sp.]|nr:MATE family efflux transporter [Butyricicoccus sp.]